MKFFRKLIFLVIPLISILLSQSIEIPNELMTKNEGINIPIFIYDVIDLESVQITLEYDESIVMAEDIVNDPFGLVGNGYSFKSKRWRIHSFAI